MNCNTKNEMSTETKLKSLIKLCFMTNVETNVYSQWRAEDFDTGVGEANFYKLNFQDDVTFLLDTPLGCIRGGVDPY